MMVFLKATRTQCDPVIILGLDGMYHLMNPMELGFLKRLVRVVVQYYTSLHD